MNKVSCLRCCRCCIIPGTDKDCKHLIRLKSGRGLCRVFKTRLGRKIGRTVINGVLMDVKCILREETSNTYKDCPFNEEEK